jgi:hypothetical protein
MKLLYVILSGIALLAYASLWYLGESIPAWHPLIWVVAVFFRDLSDYLDEKFQKSL